MDATLQILLVLLLAIDLTGSVVQIHLSRRLLALKGRPPAHRRSSAHTVEIQIEADTSQAQSKITALEADLARLEERYETVYPTAAKLRGSTMMSSREILEAVEKARQGPPNRVDAALYGLGLEPARPHFSMPRPQDVGIDYETTLNPDGRFEIEGPSGPTPHATREPVEVVTYECDECGEEVEADPEWGPDEANHKASREDCGGKWCRRVPGFVFLLAFLMSACTPEADSMGGADGDISATEVACAHGIECGEVWAGGLEECTSSTLGEGDPCYLEFEALVWCEADQATCDAACPVEEEALQACLFEAWGAGGE